MAEKYSAYQFNFEGSREKFNGRYNDDLKKYEAIFRGVTGYGETLEDAINDVVNIIQSKR